MAARSGSDTGIKSKKAKKSAAKKSPEKVPLNGTRPMVQNVSLTEARRLLQNSYTLHLALLVIMTALAAFLLVLVVKQQYAIDSLDFQLRFMRERYEYAKDWNGELLELRDQDANFDRYEDSRLFFPEVETPQE